METERAGKRSMLFVEKQARPPSDEQLKAITKWVSIFAEHHRREISELGMAIYIEFLKDMTPDAIDLACAQAFGEIDHMPTVPEIKRIARRETFQRTEQGQRGCSLCEFTGWQMISNPSGGRWATKCKCRRPA